MDDLSENAKTTRSERVKKTYASCGVCTARLPTSYIGSICIDFVRVKTACVHRCSDFFFLHFFITTLNARSDNLTNVHNVTRTPAPRGAYDDSRIVSNRVIRAQVARFNV